MWVMGWSTFLILTLPVVGGTDSTRVALIREDVVEVFDTPERGALLMGRLRRGDRVTVVGEEPGGWLAITPPSGSFSWIEATSVELLPDGKALVAVEQTRVRPGGPGARFPGAAQVTLFRGTVVRRLDLPALSLGKGASARCWLAIVPPEPERRYILADCVELPTGTSRLGRRGDEVGTQPSDAWEQVPTPLRQEFRRIDSRHRLAVSGPVDQWHLEPIRRDYAALLEQLGAREAREMVRQRLDQVSRQSEVARAAGDFQARLRVSRLRDADLERSRRSLEHDGASTDRYVAEGLIQPSFQDYEGRRLFALIGRDGQLSALLRLPPALQVDELKGNRVGVVGTARYVESLPVRLIEVRDLDPLDVAP
jgi:hypothetical protein